MVHEARNPGRKRGLVGVLKKEEILGFPNRAVDGQILDRLHRDRDARYALRLLVEPSDDLQGGLAALVARPERDQHPPAVERRVHSIDADERREAGDVLVLKNDTGERLLSASHFGKGDVLGRAGYALNRARVLDRKEALGNLDILHAGQNERPDRDNENQGLMIEDPLERVVVAVYYALKTALGRKRDPAAGRLRMVAH